MNKNNSNFKIIGISILFSIVAIALISYVTLGDFSSSAIETPSIETPSIETPVENITIDDIIENNFKFHTVQIMGLVDFPFNVHMTSRDAQSFVNDPSVELEDGGYLTFKDKTSELYQELMSVSNSVVIYPIWTSAAYSEPGFYTYFREECDESCITNLTFENPQLEFTSSGMTTQLLYDLGYQFITEVDVDKNPKILENYDTIIVLHNEYVTKNVFDSISTHPNIVYLFPNALYAEITVNYDDNTITLIRGHNYPEYEIKNGFDYEIEEKFHDYEYDQYCLDWEFIEFENGHALNCYPDGIIYNQLDILKELKDLL